MLTDNQDAPLILIVEDDDGHAELMQISLQEAHDEYRLERVCNLCDARKIIDSQTPDIILTDYRLPDGDGSELLSTVNVRCPVILLTSQGNEQMAVDAMKAGAHDYVVKSFEVFSGISRITQRGLREWSLMQNQKRSEDERQKMERHFLQIQKLESLATMSAGIAHDFNNLLQVVLGNLELTLLKLPEDAPVQNYLCQAVSAAERAAKLSSMMLAYTGKGIFNINVLSLSDLVEKITDMLAAVISKNITLDLKLDPALPPILADDDQIHQVIMNLVINASEAIGSANGSITISTGIQHFDQLVLNSSRLEGKLKAGRYVWIEVRDTGCGMDLDTRDKLFDPFFSTKFTGRGLGMSAAQGVIRAHKGAIMVDSSPGVGTSIRVLFPVAYNSQAGISLEASTVNNDDSSAISRRDTH